MVEQIANSNAVARRAYDAQESITSDYCRKLLKHSLSEVAYRREKRER